MCNLVWCYVDMLVCFAWIVAQLLDQRPSFLAVVRHISVLNENLPRFPLFHCSNLMQVVQFCLTLLLFTINKAYF